MKSHGCLNSVNPNGVFCGRNFANVTLDLQTQQPRLIFDLPPNRRSLQWEDLVLKFLLVTMNHTYDSLSRGFVAHLPPHGKLQR